MIDAIAILPARGGSKRIEHKNRKPFCGRPVIEYSIDAAIESDCFHRVVVSTDDDDILNIAKQAGADVFWRSPRYATDKAIMAEAVIETLHAYGKKGEAFDYGCVIYPAAPFITPARLREGLAQLRCGYEVVCPVWRGPAVERSMVFEGGRLASRFPEFNRVNSNEWPESYYHAGQWFWFDAAALVLNETLMPDKTGAVVIDRNEAVDIDTLEDWRWAERLYSAAHPVEVSQRLQGAVLQLARDAAYE